MKDFLKKICGKLSHLAGPSDGQDLIEYAMVVALISLGATAGMDSLAGGINTAFANVSTKLGTAVSSALLL
jgi:pilus assembly protein Flp/PilA